MGLAPPAAVDLPFEAVTTAIWDALFRAGSYPFGEAFWGRVLEREEILSVDLRALNEKHQNVKKNSREISPHHEL